MEVEDGKHDVIKDGLKLIPTLTYRSSILSLEIKKIQIYFVLSSLIRIFVPNINLTTMTANKNLNSPIFESLQGRSIGVA